MSLCPITGETPCKCRHKLSRTEFGNALLTDLKSSLRKLFSDHAWYTSWLIVESVPVLQPDNGVVAQRLLRNPDDIASLLSHIIGAEKARGVGTLFKNHLLLAAAALEPVRNGQTELVNAAVQKFYDQGNLVGAGLHQLNPHKLSQEYATAMMRQHNEYVVQLATLRQKQDYENYIVTLDAYYKHMLQFSDMVYETLTA